VRQQWATRYGPDPGVWATWKDGGGAGVDVVNGKSLGAIDNLFLPWLVFFADAARWEDAATVSAACSVLFSAPAPAVLQGEEAGTGAGGVAGARMRLRARRVARFALRSLTAHAHHLGMVATTTTTTGGGGGGGGGGGRVAAAVPLATAVLRATDGAAWGPGMGGAAAADAVLRALVAEDDLFLHLRRLVLAYLPPGGSSSSSSGSGRESSSVSAAVSAAAAAAADELLCTTCARAAASGADAAAPAAKRLAAQILSVPSLWSRGVAGSRLAAAAPALWAHAIDGLYDNPPPVLPTPTAAVVSGGASGGAAAAAAATAAGGGAAATAAAAVAAAAAAAGRGSHYSNYPAEGWLLGNLLEAAPGGLSRVGASRAGPPAAGAAGAGGGGGGAGASATAQVGLYELNSVAP
jgi:hypothetical protein